MKHDIDIFREFLSIMGYTTEWYYDNNENTEVFFLMTLSAPKEGVVYHFKTYLFTSYLAAVAVLAWDHGCSQEFQDMLGTLNRKLPEKV